MTPSAATVDLPKPARRGAISKARVLRRYLVPRDVIDLCHERNVLVPFGVAVYGGLLFAFARPTIDEMVRLLRRRGGFRFMPQAVTTAARRFERHGVLRQQVRNAYLWTHYLLGTDPHRLVHLYAYEPERF